MIFTRMLPITSSSVAAGKSTDILRPGPCVWSFFAPGSIQWPSHRCASVTSWRGAGTGVQGSWEHVQSRKPRPLFLGKTFRKLTSNGLSSVSS